MPFSGEWDTQAWAYRILYQGRTVAWRFSGGAMLDFVDYLNRLPVAEALSRLGVTEVV